MDYNKLAQELIQSVEQSSRDELASLDVAKGNAFSNINNQANAAGTLYSTGTGFKKDSWVGEKYVPAVAAAKMKPLSTKLDILSQATALTRSIDSMNRAANELNGIVFDY